MITKIEFINFIEEYQNFSSAVERLGKAIGGCSWDLFECDWCISVDKMFDIFIKSHFTCSGKSLISWWMWEDVDKVIYEKASQDLFHDEEEREIDVEDVGDLWDYMINHQNDYFK